MSLPPPSRRTRPYPAKLHIFIQDIKWYVLSKNGQQYYIPDETALIRWVYHEYLQCGRNYRAVEIFHSVQTAWLSQPFGETEECLQAFAKIIPSVFPEEYGYSIRPAVKFCGYCKKVRPIDEFAYSYSSKTKKKRYCKSCEILNTPLPSASTDEIPDTAFSPEEQRAEILRKLTAPHPTTDQLSKLDTDPDFSSSRLSDLPALDKDEL